jgi:hypothetical protein
MHNCFEKQLHITFPFLQSIIHRLQNDAFWKHAGTHKTLARFRDTTAIRHVNKTSAEYSHV